MRRQATRNSQKETRVSRLESRKTGPITPAGIYYLVLRPSIDFIIGLFLR